MHPSDWVGKRHSPDAYKKTQRISWNFDKKPLLSFRNEAIELPISDKSANASYIPLSYVFKLYQSNEYEVE